ncbi:MAG: hypothetical protein ACRDHZ_24640, partial [Ktedonobacteraceae bacterium]
METSIQNISEQQFLAFLEEGERGRWLRTYKMFKQIQRDPRYRILLEGLHLLERHQLNKSVPLLKAALNMLPFSPSAWQFYAESCFARCLYLDAWEALNHVQELLRENIFPQVLLERFFVTKALCLHELE